VTALELMPLAAFPGKRNWGYDGVFPYAPHVAYGGPEGLRRLVDASHAAGLAVLLDVVYNHLGPEGNVLPAFGPYFSERHRTPWGAALNFDGPGSDEVRRNFLDNALHWLAEYHLDGLRLDAVHAIVDLSARPFLAELAEAVRRLERTLGRPLHVIAESDANDPRLLRSPERDGLGMDAVWNDDFHHAVHAALTGERAGYYADYGTTAALAKSFDDVFVFDGAYSAHRERRHGAAATGLARDRFVVFVQNHDQIGNRAQGERLEALLPPAACRLATSLLLLSPGLPLLFMGELGSGLG
jgi:maltooligosyltrehalose trehalohydrolase